MLEITLPLPYRELSPNHTVGSRGQRLAKSAKVKRYRNESCEAAMVAVADLEDWRACGFPWLEAVIQIRWFAKTKPFPDADNALASLKAAFDGLVDAGVLSDDRRVTYPPVEIAKDADWPRVELVISRRET